jgi:hypothetical protein
VTPPAASSAPARPAGRRAAPRPRSEARPRLRPVEAPGSKKRRIARLLAPVLLVASLLAVVIGQALLAEGQVRLAGLEVSMSAAQVQHRQAELAVAQLETPSRIVGDAGARQGLVTPPGLTQLPSVPLDQPLPTPKLTPPPATTTTTVAAGAGGTTTGSVGATASGSGTSTGATPGTTLTTEPLTTLTPNGTGPPAPGQ